MKKLFLFGLMMSMIILSGCAETTYHYLCNAKVVELKSKGGFLDHRYIVVLETDEGKSSLEIRHDLYKKLELDTTINVRYNEIGEVDRFDYDMEGCKKREEKKEKGS